MSSLSTLPKGDSAWLLRKSIQRIMQQVSVLETNIGSSTTGNSANTQVIFNDNGTLRGDTGLTFNKTTDLLTVGAATITGDLTVDTSTLKVDSANNRVGIVNASPSFALDVNGAGSGVSARISSGSGTGFRFDTTRNVGGLNRNYLIGCDVLNEGWFSIVPSTALGGGTFTNSIYNASYDGTHAWSDGAGGERMRLNATGLGVGTSPTYKLDVSSSSNIVGRLSSSSVFNTGFNITNTTGSTWSLYSFGSNDATLQNSFGIYHQSGTSFLQITQAGNVGIGVTPSAWGIYKGLQVGYASLAGYAGSDTLLGSNVYFDGGAFKYIAAGLASSYRQLAGGHQWSTAVAGANPGDPLTLLPQMTLDASGNLLVAGTSAYIRAGGRTQIVGGSVVDINTVGNNVGIAFGGASSILPCDGSSTTTDGVANFGSASKRWNTIYASTGTINTSDQNEKQDIADLGDAEKRVAGKIKSLVKKYRFKDAVASKGENARIHVGWIAQDIQNAFSSEGLDASKYGVFCSDTWEENGVQKTRLGLRYDEVLAFVVSVI